VSSAGQLLVAGRIPGEEIASTEVTADSATFDDSPEVVVISVTAPVVAGRTYRIVFDGHGNSSTGTDAITFRIRDTDASGTERQTDRCNITGSTTSGASSHMERKITVTGTENRTWVVTGVRVGATGGNCFLEASGTRPTYLTVYYVSG
jgi:hypothetical protein